METRPISKSADIAEIDRPDASVDVRLVVTTAVT
jgi:hypothetical protein